MFAVWCLYNFSFDKLKLLEEQLFAQKGQTSFCLTA